MKKPASQIYILEPSHMRSWVTESAPKSRSAKVLHVQSLLTGQTHGMTSDQARECFGRSTRSSRLEETGDTTIMALVNGKTDLLKCSFDPEALDGIPSASLKSEPWVIKHYDGEWPWTNQPLKNGERPVNSTVRHGADDSASPASGSNVGAFRAWS